MLNKILFILPLLLSAFGAKAQSVCSQPNLSKLVQQGIPAFKQKSFVEKIKSSQVLIAGDLHFLTNLEAMARLIQEFQKQHTKKTCVAFELPARDYNFDVFLKNIVDIVADAEKQPEYSTDKDLQNYVESLKRLHVYYYPISEYALSLQLKVKSVDHKDKWGQAMTLEARNIAISENVQKLISSKECSAVLLIIGKAHLSEEVPQHKIQNLLKSRDLKVASVNLQMTQEKNIPKEVRSWQVCPTNDVTLTELSVLDNKSLQGAPVLTGKTLWKDFDFTLLIP